VKYLAVIFIYFLILFTSKKANSQLTSSSLRHFTIENGLPSSEIYVVLQDKKGNLWFGTDRGLVRYDGYDFKTFSYQDGLTDNTVFKLQEDSIGRIWMLTFSGRLFYLENSTVRPYKYNDKLLEISSNRMPNSFFVDPDNNIHISYHSIGIFTVNETGIITWRFKITPKNGMCYFIDEITPDNILLSNKYFSNGSPAILIHSYKNKIDTTEIYLKPEDRFCAVRLSKEKIIISISNYLYEKTEKGLFQIDKLPGVVYALAKISPSVFNVCTANGVYQFEEKNGYRNSTLSLQDNNVTNYVQDNENGSWYTTLNNGIFYSAGYGVNAIKFNPELLNKPLSIAGDRNSTIYIGCMDGTLVKLKNGLYSKLFIPDKQKANQPIANLTTFENDPNIYLSQTLPCIYKDEKFIFFNTDLSWSTKTDFIKKTNGQLYVAGTVFIFQLSNNSLINFFTTKYRINCLADLGKNKLLLGTNNGAQIFDEVSKETTSFHPELNGIRIDDIQWLNKMPVFASKGKGILMIGHDTIIHIDEKNGLSSNLVNKILVDGNEIWCATNKGISHIQLPEPGNKEIKVTAIQSSHGLLSDEVSDITLQNDTIYATSNSGISYFNSKINFTNTTPPPIYITTLSINNVDTVIVPNMIFKPNQNNINIGFNGISFRSNQKLKYSYQLINGNDTVSSLSYNRNVEFFSLKPGQYTFAVIAINNSGIPSQNAAFFEFTILPYWWQTFWFKVILVSIIALGIYLFYLNKVRKLKHTFEIERKQASLQLTAMRAQMNPHFIFNVMNSIRNYMQNHDTKSAEKYLTSFSRLVRYTLDNSEVHEVTLEEELNAIRNYVELEMQRFDNGFEFNIICEAGIDPGETMLLSMLLQPYVENSIKHGISRMEVGGKILIDIRSNKNTILIGIEDNGIGKDESLQWNKDHLENHISHGTMINSERIAAYNKVFNKNIKVRTINLINGEGKANGTRVEIEV
jgi:hypothetical protein